MTTPEGRREPQLRRRVLILGGLGAAVVVLRLLSSCAAPGPGPASATLNLWSDPVSCSTCSSLEVPGPTV
ncbi:MAG: hypothetical protein FWF21_08145 [Micrococcales bacterium]|nr:hypothetical protein [Micrococcales bacterium]